MAGVFFDLPKIRMEMAGIGNEGCAYQLQCAIQAVLALPIHSGPSRSPTLGRAVASSSHFQPKGPKALRARSQRGAPHLWEDSVPELRGSVFRSVQSTRTALEHYFQGASFPTHVRGVRAVRVKSHVLLGLRGRRFGGTHERSGTNVPPWHSRCHGFVQVGDFRFWLTG